MKLRRFELEKEIGTVEIVLEKRTLTQRKTAGATEPTVAKNTFDTVKEANEEFARFEQIYARRGKLVASEDDAEAVAKPKKLLLVLLDWIEEQGVAPADPDQPQPGPRYFGEELWPLIEEGDLELRLKKGKLHATLRTISTVSEGRWSMRHHVTVGSQLDELLSLPVVARLSGLKLLPTAAFNDGEEAVTWDVKRAVTSLADSPARASITDLHLGSKDAPNPDLGDLSRSLAALVNLERLHLHSTKGVRVGELELNKLEELHIASLCTHQQTQSFLKNLWPSLTTLELDVEGNGHAPVLAAALKGARLPRLQHLTVRGLDAGAAELRTELAGSEALSRLKTFRLPASATSVSPTPRVRAGE